MYNGIGLQTPRGSGTNGHIQSNKFFVRPKTGKVAIDNNKGFDPGQGTAGLTKNPNKDILEHDRKRQIQLKLVELEDKLVDQGYTDSEIAQKLDETRRTLEAVSLSGESGGPTAIVLSDKKFSNTQTHQIALRKEKQMETLKAALGIGSELDNRKKQDDASEECYDDNNDRPRNSWKKNSSEDVKGHVKDISDQKDNMKKGVKNKNGSVREGDKKEESKRRDEDSYDTDDSEKSLERTKKHRKDGQGIDSDYDSEIDVRKKKIEKSSSKHKKNRHDSEDCEFEYVSDFDEKDERARKRKDSDDDSGSDESPKRNTRRVKQLLKMSKRQNSEDESDPEEKDYRKQSERKSHRHGGRYASERESGHDKATKNKREKVEKSGRRRHDTDEDESDTDSREEGERKQSEGKRHQHGGRQVVERVSGYDKATKDKKEKVEKSGRRRNDRDEDDSKYESDTDSREEGERNQSDRKRHQHGGKYAVEREPGYDKATKNEKEKVEKSGRRRHDTDEDDPKYESDTDSREEGERNQSDRKRHQHGERYAVERESGYDKGTKNKKEKVENSGRRRHDRDEDDSRYESDTYSREGGERKVGKQSEIKRHQHGGRYAVERESGYDKATKNEKERVEKSGRRRYKSDEDDSKYESDTYSREEGERKQSEIKRHQHGGRYAVEREFGYDKATKNEKERVEKGGRRRRDTDEDESDIDSGEEDGRKQSERKRHHGGRYTVEIKSDYDKATKNKKDKVEKSVGRQHDTDEDDSDNDVEGKVNRSQKSRRQYCDEDGGEGTENDKFRKKRESSSARDTIGYRHEKVSLCKPVEKRGSGRAYGPSGKGGRGLEEKIAVETDDTRKENHGNHNVDDASHTFKKLEEMYQPRRDTMDGSANVSREMMKGKRKADNGNQDEQEATVKRQNFGKEEKCGGELQKDLRSFSDKDVRRRPDYSKLDRYGRGREGENFERGIRIQSRSELHHTSTKNDRDHEEHRGGRIPSRDEEDHGRKHKRDEEEMYGKHVKDGEHQRRRHGREIEEENGSARYERDRQLDSSKRAKNDDSHSSKRRRYGDDQHHDRR